MSMQSEGKDAKGRNYDQATRDGSSSAGSMGSGGTGDIGAMGGAGQGSQQSASRTDDLLAGDTTDQEAEQAFSGGSQGGQIQTGMEGIGKQDGGAGGSRQSAPPPARQGNMPTDKTDADQYDQGSAPRER